MKTLILFFVITFTGLFSFAHIPNQEKAETNMKRPILYGYGAGGMTLGNTYEQSKILLTEPSKGPYENGVALYDEKIVVLWENDSPNNDSLPKMIFVVKDYLGTLDAGEKIGKIKPGDRIKGFYFKDNPLKAAQDITNELYNVLEKTGENKVDCLETMDCRLIFGSELQRNFVIVLPKMVALIDREDFSLRELRLIP